jgi:hypothetical protein
MQTFEEIARFHEDLECNYHEGIKEYHCGRLQGLTKKQALAIAHKEGITYQHFRSMGEAEVPIHFLTFSYSPIAIYALYCFSSFFGPKSQRTGIFN